MGNMKCKIDFNNKEIIVDGHKCVETEYKGIYKVQDEFIVIPEEWGKDKSNYDLAILYEYNDKELVSATVKYIMHHGNKEYDRFIQHLKSCGLEYCRIACLHYNLPIFFMGGLRPW